MLATRSVFLLQICYVNLSLHHWLKAAGDKSKFLLDLCNSPQNIYPRFLCLLKPAKVSFQSELSPKQDHSIFCSIPPHLLPTPISDYSLTTWLRVMQTSLYQHAQESCSHLYGKTLCFLITLVCGCVWRYALKFISLYLLNYWAVETSWEVNLTWLKPLSSLNGNVQDEQK